MLTETTFYLHGYGIWQVSQSHPRHYACRFRFARSGLQAAEHSSLQGKLRPVGARLGDRMLSKAECSPAASHRAAISVRVWMTQERCICSAAKSLRPTQTDVLCDVGVRLVACREARGWGALRGAACRQALQGRRPRAYRALRPAWAGPVPG